jgi:hypothetical protein
MRIPTAKAKENEIASTTFRGKPTWTNQTADLLLQVWRRRYLKEQIYSHRQIEFAVNDDDTVLSAGHFVEWRGPPLTTLDEFFEEADYLSTPDAQMAKVLLENWDEADIPPFDFGTVVRFERLTIKATRHSGYIWQLIRSIMEKEFANRGALLLLKPFPLEYEGCVTESNRGAFMFRVAALQRLYAHRIDMMPVPVDKEGWMWRPLRYCPEPRRPKR